MAWSRQIDPSMCEHYVALWKTDLDTWEQRLKDVPIGLSVKEALRELDLMPSARSPYALAGILGGGPVDAIRTRDSRPLITGRHRRVPELVPSVIRYLAQLSMASA